MYRTWVAKTKIRDYRKIKTNFLQLSNISETITIYIGDTHPAMDNNLQVQ